MSAHPPQHIQALQRGNMLRLARTKIKQQLGTLPREEAFGLLADLLETVPECCEKATAFELLTSVRFVGRFYALSWLRKAGVQEERYLRELTERQRLALAARLRAGEGRAAA